MPLEVKELIIKVTVSDQVNNQSAEPAHAADLENMKRQIVAECFEKIMDQLKVAKER